MVKTVQTYKLEAGKYLCYVLENIAAAKTEEECSSLLSVNIKTYEPITKLDNLWQIYFSEDFESSIAAVSNRRSGSSNTWPTNRLNQRKFFDELTEMFKNLKPIRPSCLHDHIEISE